MKIFQQLWKRGINWDEPLPPDIRRQWMNWRECLCELSNLRIPRCYTPIHCQIVDQHLVGFSDALTLRSTDTTGEVHISLVMAKTRVAPIKKVLLPRLELCGALLLAQIMSHLQEVLSIPTLNSYAFTDSSIVLYWIYGTSQRFKTFEANRISKIQDLIPPERWKHVVGLQNPADVGSGGLLANELKEHQLWWSGSDWMKENPSNRPSKFTAPPSFEALQSLDVTNNSLQLKEKEQITMQTTTDTAPTVEPVIDINRYSSYSQLVRIMAMAIQSQDVFHQASPSSNVSNHHQNIKKEETVTILRPVAVVERLFG